MAQLTTQKGARHCPVQPTRVAGAKAEPPAITAHWIKFFEFRYFVWPVLSVFTCKSVTLMDCSFPLTIKPCKIKKQSAVHFLTLFLISEPGLCRPKQKVRLSLKLALRGANQGLERYLRSLSKALAALSQTRAAGSATGMNDNVLPLARLWRQSPNYHLEFLRSHSFVLKNHSDFACEYKE